MIAVELTFCEESSMSVFLSTKSSAMETQTQTTGPKHNVGSMINI